MAATKKALTLFSYLAEHGETEKTELMQIVGYARREQAFAQLLTFVRNDCGQGIYTKTTQAGAVSYVLHNDYKFEIP